MRIGELAKLGQVSKDTVRYYVELGLLLAGKNPDNGYQEFSPAMANRLQFIKTAQRLGFKLEEITDIFRSAEQSESPCANVRDIIQRRIIQTRQQILDLERLCQRMESALTAWENLPDGVPNGNSVCRLIESQFLPNQQT